MGQQAAEALPSCPWGVQVGVVVEVLLGALETKLGFSNCIAIATVTRVSEAMPNHLGQMRIGMRNAVYQISASMELKLQFPRPGSRATVLKKLHYKNKGGKGEGAA